MSERQRYLWTGRAVTRHHGGWGEPGKTFAIGLGCEIRHAHRLVYADGLDLTNVSAATHIGMGCRVCERLDCPQRAAPPLGHPLRIDQDLAGSRLLARHQKSQQQVSVSPRTPGGS